ncbi:MAG: hypothetical protein D6698_06805 [Gammaproteobacteria bacterium]|nr:MAG: hypothetical protein D6698_06805 [Gammaproteobacteria bacterium]
MPIKSNIKRCPLLKVTRTIINDGSIETVEEFNDCYQKFCSAWDAKNKVCSYFSSYEEEIEESSEEEDDDD